MGYSTRYILHIPRSPIYIIVLSRRFTRQMPPLHVQFPFDQRPVLESLSIHTNSNNQRRTSTKPPNHSPTQMQTPPAMPPKTPTPPTPTPHKEDTPIHNPIKSPTPPTNQPTNQPTTTPSSLFPLSPSSPSSPSSSSPPSAQYSPSAS